MSQRQDMKIIMPETRKALIEKYREQLKNAVKSLPGGNISEKELDRIADEYADRLGDEKTLDDIKDAFSECLRSVRTRAENADVKVEHWAQIDNTIDDLKNQFGKDYEMVTDMKEGADREFQKRLEDLYETNERIIRETKEQSPTDLPNLDDSFDEQLDNQEKPPFSTYERNPFTSEEKKEETKKEESPKMDLDILKDIMEKANKIVTEEDFLRYANEIGSLSAQLGKHRNEEQTHSNDKKEIGE